VFINDKIPYYGAGEQMNEEIDITKIETPELLELIQDDLYDGLADEVVASVNELLAREMTPYDVLTRGLVAGMEVVGFDFRDGILFVPEVLMAAKAMKAGMEILRPLLVETGAPQMGTLVIGTVKGDIHDIGKNLVAMMMEGAGFNVINLGINTNVEAFLEAIQEHNPDILGMSAMLTTTMPYMGVVIEALEEKGIREQLLVLVGGAPLNDAFAEEIRADAYCRDAAVGVETAKKLMAIKRGQPG
jgi:methylmalonyl-CoA mutase cobalamin-binding domain/chain